MKRPSLRERLAVAVEASRDVAAIAAALGVSERTVRRALRDRAERRMRCLALVCGAGVAAA